MRPLQSRSVLFSMGRSGLAGACLVFALTGCSTRGLVIDPPSMPPPPADDAGTRVVLGGVSDARVFTHSSFASPMPSTRGDPNDAAWTRRVFGRQLAGMRTLGGDRFTYDTAGVPGLVRAALAVGLARSGHAVVSDEHHDASDAPRLDATIEMFWLRQAQQSTSAKLIYQADVVISGDLPGFEVPVHVTAQGSIVSGAADGVLWRRAVARTLEALAAEMALAGAPTDGDATSKVP